MNLKRPRNLKRQHPFWTDPTWIGLFLGLLALGSSFHLLTTQPPLAPEAPYSRYLEDLEANRLKAIIYPHPAILSGAEPLTFEVQLQNGERYRVLYPRHVPSELRESWLKLKGVSLEPTPLPWPTQAWLGLGRCLDVCLRFGVEVFLGFCLLFLLLNGRPHLGFGRSRGPSPGEPTTPGQEPITLASVAGNEEAKAETQSLIQFLKNPAPFQAIGARLPKGVLLSGLPGTGKTLLAKAIAGEADVPFFSCSGSEFEEKYVGVGASRIRNLFQLAQKNAPCLIFIDEIDSIGNQRQLRDSSSSIQTLNQLLVEMDGFEEREQPIIVIGATNRPSDLDPALTRPGRFDRRVHLHPPSLQERIAILKLKGQRLKLIEDFPYDRVGRMTTGLVGADLANLMNESALRAVELQHDVVQLSDVEYAYDRILMGAPRHSLRPTPDERSRTAYHEAGHALVALALPGMDPIRKLTILPTGDSLGATHTVSESERLHLDARYLKNRLAVCCGGRAAEALMYGEEGVSLGASSGPGSDFATATRLAYRMVAQHGLVEGIGMVYHEAEQLRQYGLSNKNLAKIEQAVKKLIDDAYQQALRILQPNLSLLNRFHDNLLERETLDLTDLEQLLQSEPLQPFQSST